MDQDLKSFIDYLKGTKYEICIYDWSGGTFSCGWYPITDEELEKLIADYQASETRKVT